MKKTLQFGFLALSLLFSIKSAKSQTISNEFFGVNAWMPDTIGNYYACPEAPCYFNGKLHKNWQKVKASGATIVRFGGISADRNKPTNFQYIRMIDSIRANGMEPIIQVPFFNYRYTAQQAADIVRYINVVKGKNIKYWIIGNEPNLSYSYTTAAQVANYFKPFASAMKNVDPSILIIGPEPAWYDQTMINGLTTPGGASDITGKDGAGRYYVDIFSFHTYPFNGTQTRSQVVSKLTSSGSLKDNLAALNSRLAAANSYHGRTGAAALKTAITEANVDYKNSSTDNLNGVGANSFIGGQFVAEMMSVGMKNGLDFFNLWSVVEGNSTALNIGFLDNSTGNKKPLYYHFKLLADNFRGNYVNGTTNQVNVKSFASQDGQQVAVMILNEDMTNNFTYTVRLNTTAIAGTSALKINANAGLAKEFTDVIQNQSTTLLIFDANGNIIKKSEYKLSGNANLNLPPTVTILSSSQTATIIPSGPTNFCAGGSVMLNANTGSGYTYQWKKDNVAISGATNSSYTATASGSYSVAITIAGVTNSSSAISITVSPMPIATVTPAGSTSFATGGNVVLNASTGTGYIYQWKKDNINITGATGASYTASTAGAYQVAINQGICSALSTAVVISVISSSAIIAPAGPTTFCAGGSVTLNANTGTGNTYQWKKDNIVISGANGSAYIATVSGSYTVAITTSGITSTSAAVIITVSPMPTATITPAGPTSFVAGGSVILNAPTGTGYIYQWKKDGVNISGATNSTYLATLAGSYQIKITQGSCIDWSAPLAITIVTSTTATITPAGPTNFCAGGSVTLNANTGSGYTYQWKKDNVAISGATNSSYTATASGNYSVAITIAGVTNTSSAIAITVSPMPIATVTAAGSTSFATGGSVVLNAGTGTGYIYQWKKDSVAITGATNASYTASLAGSYQVEINQGICSAVSAAVVISILSTAIISPAGPTTFCAGGSVTLNANTGTGNTYQWKKDNIAISGANDAYYIATLSGSYTVAITTLGITGTSAAVVITVSPLPNATITPSGALSFVAGDSVVLNASTGTGYIYQWKKDNLGITGATNASYTAFTAGSYQIKITQGECMDWSAPVLINIVPTATITPAGPTSVCTGGSVTLNANAGTGYTYQWKKDNIDLSGASNSSYIANATGNYSVVVTSGSLINTSASLAVTVIPVPLATITPLGATTMCSGSVGLQANLGSGLMYQWIKDNNLIAGATNALYSASASGSYQIKITQGSCTALSVPTSVNIQSGLVASITPGGPTEFCSGGNVTLYASTCSGYKYQWKKDGTNISGATSSTYTASVTGKYQVRINKNGVKDWSAILAVIVTNCKELDNASKEPLTDSANDSSIISLVTNYEMGTENNFEINIFPNPTNGNYFIELENENSEENNFEIVVANTIGQTIYHKYSTFSAKKEEIRFSENDPGGIYIVHVKAKNKIATKKIIFNK